MRSWKVRTVLIGVVIAGVAGQGLADSIVLQPSSQDAFVQKNKPNRIAGSGPTHTRIRIRASPPDTQTRRGLVQFDLSPVPTGSSVNSATLEVFEGNNPGEVVTHGAHRVDDEWLQSAVKFQFNVTLLKENVAELPAIVEMAAELDVDMVAVGYVIAHSERVQASSPLHSPGETNRALAAAAKRSAELGIEVRLPAPLPEAKATPPVTIERPDGWPGQYYCDMPWRRAFIGLEGDVKPCCAPQAPVMGNAFRQDFMEIWNGPGYRELRSGLTTGKLTSYCRRCPYLQEVGAKPYRSTAFDRVGGSSE